MVFTSKNALAPSFAVAGVLACGINMAWLIICVFGYAVCEPLLLNISSNMLPSRAVFAVLLPSPLLLSWMEFIMQPIETIRTAHATNYFDALRYDLSTILTAMLFVCLLSVLLAACCFMRHRRYAHHGAIAWAIFVLITGVPGFIGYLLHRRWPVVVRCEHCGAQTPRDRDTCLNCGTAFPPPAPKGIEVFA